MVLILNSYIMSSLPPDNLENLLDVGTSKKPLRTIDDVKTRLGLLQQSEQVQSTKFSFLSKESMNETDSTKSKSFYQKSLLSKLDQIRKSSKILQGEGFSNENGSKMNE